MNRSLLHRIAEAVRSIEHDSAPAEPEPAPAQPVEPGPEPLPPSQRRVKVSFDEVLAARGYSSPFMRRQIAPLSCAKRARRAAEAAIGWAGQDVLWPD